MNAITDLCSEAVSYLTLIQDILKDKPKEEFVKARRLAFWKDDILHLSLADCDGFKGRIGELVWSSKGGEATDEMLTWFSAVAGGLLKWLNTYLPETGKEDRALILDQRPHFWREKIRRILYDNDESRTILAAELHYMPLQVIQALAGPEINIYNQRLMQVYLERDMERNPMFSTTDQDKLHEWWGKNRERATELLKNDDVLYLQLVEANEPLPFDSLFHQELDQIFAGRIKRAGDATMGGATGGGNSLAGGKGSAEPAPPGGGPIDPSRNDKDPLERAGALKLSGLAFSGGGIRSGTFSLGILQKLAKLGLLSHFDYLSTVSGGGYIGSWYCSWIRTAGSVKKVTERLNPDISPEPRAEEVRPIRWLRMFSNYLAPDASAMSVDVWTMAITWVRNTLINQSVLLLLLLTVLSAINLAFNWWLDIQKEYHGGRSLLWMWSIVIFGVAGFLAASGMRSYDRNSPPQSKKNLVGVGSLVPVLVIWSVMAALFASTWFYLQPSTAFNKRFVTLWPCGITSAVCMAGVACFGNYYKHVIGKGVSWLRVIAIIISSAAAGLALQLLLAVSWQLIFLLKHCGGSWLHCFFKTSFEPMLVVITGLPLMLEAISITVVFRMALLGNLFPDERREWWGRLGAITHRFAFIWMLISACALLLPVFFFRIVPHIQFRQSMVIIFGSWAAFIGTAVKFAYGASTGGDKGSGGPNVKEILIGIAPYLFMVGFLLIGAWLLNYVQLFESHCSWFSKKPLLSGLEMTVLLTLLTLGLGWRIGVNEFSLHHFYRNRLVRGYLGAVRRRTDRENTANSFTGFDKKDDYPLAHLVAGGADGYMGPYPLLNATLNATTVTELDRQDRKGESFLFSPLYCGFDFSPVRSAAYTRDQIYDYGYRPTEKFSGPQGPTLGTAMATSGAAVDPNMGYHSSTPIAFLLTMFNLRLGWWFGNPMRNTWQRSDPRAGLSYLVKDLVAKSDISSRYVSVSDGGHFDNMGLYELVRRRCTYIMVCDGEGDADVICEGLAVAIRRCYIDFGTTIDLDITDIVTKNKDTGYSVKHLAIGTITYSGQSKPNGTIVYVKTTLTPDTTPDIREYAKTNPQFPQQSTLDQFFDEAQFESYRKLGYSSITNLAELGVDEKLLSVSRPDLIPLLPLPKLPHK